MAGKRKTVEVRSVISRINGMLAANVHDDARQSLCILAESILFDTGNYQGFTYMQADMTPETTSNVQAGNYVEYRRRYSIPKD